MRRRGWQVSQLGLLRGDFVALDSLAGKVAHRLVVDLRASRSDVHQESGNGVDAHVARAGGSSHAISFDEAVKDSCPAL